MNEEDIYDIAFSLDDSITSIEKISLFNKYKCSKNILNIPKSTLKNILGRRWKGNKYEPEQLIKKASYIKYFLEKCNIKIVRFNQNNYPFGLTQIPDPPFLLYYKGNINFDFNKSISIVGTRDPDNEGINEAIIFSRELTKNNWTIISGLAYGIDSISHKECLNNNGKTIAVLGCGIDIIYPSQNKDIAREILDKDGAIISEYPPGVSPKKWYFPKRNRIIVGLSRCVLIIQSPERSGSLISAFLAGDYNRNLYVYKPEDENNQKFYGNNMLIKTGAYPVTNFSELYNDISFD